MTFILPGGRSRNAYPQRKMLPGDIYLPRSPFDPVLETVGVLVPALTNRQRTINMARAQAASIKGRKRTLTLQQRTMKRFARTAAGKAAKREVSAILMRFRYFGEVPNG